MITIFKQVGIGMLQNLYLNYPNLVYKSIEGKSIICTKLIKQQAHRGCLKLADKQPPVLLES